MLTTDSQHGTPGGLHVGFPTNRLRIKVANASTGAESIIPDAQETATDNCAIILMKCAARRSTSYSIGGKSAMPTMLPQWQRCHLRGTVVIFHVRMITAPQLRPASL